MKRLLFFFHGQALAHTIRPLVMARALSARGIPVTLAGTGRHVPLIAREGFDVCDLETIPQSRIDDFVARNDYAYYDSAWIDRSVKAERALMRRIRPGLVIGDLRPTALISSQLEGIDLAVIRQAYEQPGYPYRLRRGRFRWLKVRAPFIRYLLRHASELRPHHTLSLMADIPEFHPPGPGGPLKGWHYAGPLNDRPRDQERIECLDAGWDIRTPLIYLTLGSTGWPPDYLEAVLEGFTRAPYRLIVTTAGRWSGSIRGENIRVLDYLPGEWILSRAKALVGIVGSGSIYQALRRGVPVIGAPEQLDHEYHLNRVESLGLGMRLSRRDMSADGILRALQRVLDGEAGFRQRCEAFSAHLARWEGGEAAADVIEEHLRSRRPPRLSQPRSFCRTFFSAQDSKWPKCISRRARMP